MKKLFFLVVLILAVNAINAQKSIDALFEKYAGNDGFTTVSINGNLLKPAICHDGNNESSMPADITEMRILTQDGKNAHVENFYELIIRDIDLTLYEEFMRVKESDQDVRMLVRSEGKNIKELLLITWGSDNAMIQIKGNISFEEAKKFSDEAKKNHGAVN